MPERGDLVQPQDGVLLDHVRHAVRQLEGGPALDGGYPHLTDGGQDHGVGAEREPVPAGRTDRAHHRGGGQHCDEGEGAHRACGHGLRDGGAPGRAVAEDQPGCHGSRAHRAGRQRGRGLPADDRQPIAEHRIVPLARGEGTNHTAPGTRGLCRPRAPGGE